MGCGQGAVPCTRIHVGAVTPSLSTASSKMVALRPIPSLLHCWASAAASACILLCIKYSLHGALFRQQFTKMTGKYGIENPTFGDQSMMRRT